MPADGIALRWRRNESNHQPHHCLLNRLFGCRSKKTSKLCVSGLCAGNSPGTGEFPTQMASYAENVSIWWRHHGFVRCWDICRHSEDQVFGLLHHYSDAIMSATVSEITSISIVCWTVCSGAHKKSIKATHRWPLWGESIGDQWIPLTKDQ